jgi:hypothetical protein
MEPERKIEKLLRAFAKKRRADAGDSLKLHPATRRMLQGEVARRRAAAPEEDSVSLWQFFRQQWAFLLTFALAIFFGAALFLPALSKAKFKTKNVVAMNQLKQIGVAAQMVAAENNGKLPASLDALTNDLISAKELTDPVSGQRFVYAAGGEKLDELQSNSVLAYSPVDKKGRAVLLADGNVQRMNTAQFDEAARRGLVPQITPPVLAGKSSEVASRSELAANRPAAAVAPVTPTGTLAANGVARDFTDGGGGGANGFGHGVENLGAIGGQAAAPAASSPSNGDLLTLAEREPPEQKQLFKATGQTDTGLSNLSNNFQRFRQTLADDAKTTPVLASFEVQQNGNAIAVVDHDGSVYTGSIQPEIPAAQGETLTAVPLPSEKTKDLDIAKNEQQAAQNNLAQNNYFFRVAGQNRTSKQNVVFVGNIVPLTNTLADAQQNQLGRPAVVAKALLPTTNGQMQSQTALFANSRITGTVTVGATNQIKIYAVPVAP